MDSPDSAADAPPIFATPLEGAAYMLQHGFHLLPLHPKSKIPAVENWPEWSKTFTLEKLQNLPAGYDANWGVHPGPSGHFVLDIDCGTKKGKQGKGLDSLAALVEKHGPLPKTFTVLTPSGGMHLYFKGKVANTVGQLGVNIDSRGENGMVVAPGSVLSAGEYRIGNNGGQAEAPRWLIDGLQKREQPVLDRPEPDALDKPEHVASVITYLAEAPICIEGENGDGQMFKVFAQCRDLGVSRRKAIKLVLEHYNPRCLPPWNYDDETDHNHLHQKARNAYEYSQNSPGAKTVEAATASAIADFTVVPLPKEGNPPLPLLRASTIEGLSIPKRDWIIHGFLLGSFLSITGAPGGTGKSNFEILKAMAVVSGKSLLGENYAVVRRGPVVLYNCEDPLDEMVRRIEAFRIDNGLSRHSLRNLHLVSGRDHSLSVAGVNQAGEVQINAKAVKTLISTVSSVGAVLFSADPMVRTHWLNENDNMAMDKVTQAFQRVSTETGCAVSLVHHTNKGAMKTDSTDSASQVGFRGAGSMVASARVGHLLTAMGPEEAKKLGVPVEKRRWYFKVENAKANLSAPSETADWFSAAGIAIPNHEIIGVCRDADLATKTLAAREEKEVSDREAVVKFLDGFLGGRLEASFADVAAAGASHGLAFASPKDRSVQAGILRELLAGTQYSVETDGRAKADWTVRKETFLD